MGDVNELVERLLARYWDLAYAEGREGRSHDTPVGDAQETLSAIQDALTSLIAERDGLREALKPFAMQGWADENGWTDRGCPNDRICDWFGPSDFATALSLDTNKGDDHGKR